MPERCKCGHTYSMHLSIVGFPEPQVCYGHCIDGSGMLFHCECKKFITFKDKSESKKKGGGSKVSADPELSDMYLAEWDHCKEHLLEAKKQIASLLRIAEAAKLYLSLTWDGSDQAMLMRELLKSYETTYGEIGGKDERVS